MGTREDDRRAREDELGRIDAERDQLLFDLRLERRIRPAGEPPSALRLRYEELEARRKQLKTELRALGS